jgi:putative endonuclease
MNTTGELGEHIACRYLQKHGYRIVERNYSKKWGEIDIIAEKGGTLTFVEVKTQEVAIVKDTPEEHTSQPEERVDARKKRRLARAISTYLSHKSREDDDWQFLVAVVELNTDSKQARVRVIPDVIDAL